MNPRRIWTPNGASRQQDEKLVMVGTGYLWILFIRPLAVHEVVGQLQRNFWLHNSIYVFPLLAFYLCSVVEAFWPACRKEFVKKGTRNATWDKWIFLPLCKILLQHEHLRTFRFVTCLSWRRGTPDTPEPSQPDPWYSTLCFWYETEQTGWRS